MEHHAEEIEGQMGDDGVDPPAHPDIDKLKIKKLIKNYCFFWNADFRSDVLEPYGSIGPLFV